MLALGATPAEALKKTSSGLRTDLTDSSSLNTQEKLVVDLAPESYLEMFGTVIQNVGVLGIPFNVVNLARGI